MPAEVLELLATDHSSTIANAAAVLLSALSGASSHGPAGTRFGEGGRRHPQDPPTEQSWLDDVLSGLTDNDDRQGYS